MGARNVADFLLSVLQGIAPFIPVRCSRPSGRFAPPVRALVR